MGLAERRATKEFQEKVLPALRAELDKLAGRPLELEINWDQLAKEDHGESYSESWRKVYFQPVITALKSITRDDLGKEAIQQGLRKLVLCNSRGAYSADSAISFVAGELTIDHDPCTNVDYVDERADYIIKIVEKAL
ncbi:MAG: hypothetical protein IPI49_25780 [Myxococcales bacterium]|nr:hypothetical protein [Myxococcales bacterium]